MRKKRSVVRAARHRSASPQRGNSPPWTCLATARWLLAEPAAPRRGSSSTRRSRSASPQRGGSSLSRQLPVAAAPRRAGRSTPTPPTGLAAGSSPRPARRRLLLAAARRAQPRPAPRHASSSPAAWGSSTPAGRSRWRGPRQRFGSLERATLFLVSFLVRRILGSAFGYAVGECFFTVHDPFWVWVVVWVFCWR